MPKRTRRQSRRHRRRRRSRSRCGGQALPSIIHQALLPASLYYLQKKQQRTSRRGGKYRKGSPSKTRRGRSNFLTHLGSTVYDQAGHFVKKLKKPYTRRRRRRRRRRR